MLLTYATVDFHLFYVDFHLFYDEAADIKI